MWIEVCGSVELRLQLMVYPRPPSIQAYHDRRRSGEREDEEVGNFDDVAAVMVTDVRIDGSWFLGLDR